ncbi:MAG: nuclear transport factor 2 family protein [Cyclobacteriaceae bacterium]
MNRFLIFSLVLFGHISFAQSGDKEVINLLAKQDSLFWVGYNTCNLELMSTQLMPDLKFYHDQGGIIEGVEGMKEAMKANICADPKNKVLREAVPGTFKIYLLKNGDETYGAVASGDHFFSNSYDGAPWHKNSTAKFTSLWLLKDGKWQMQTIFSFAHLDME